MRPAVEPAAVVIHATGKLDTIERGSAIKIVR
jgi:hypothetical protein